MKKLLLIVTKYVGGDSWKFILTLLIVASCNQIAKEEIKTSDKIEINNDINKNGLYGNIKSITSEQSQITEKFDGYAKNKNKKNWGKYRSRSMNQYYTYNIYGLKRFNNYFLQDSHIIFNKFGNIKSIDGFHNRQLVSNTIYEYDTNNILISEKWYEQKETLKYETIFTYQDNGDLESKTFQYPNKDLEARLIHSFDTNNNVRSLMVYKTGKVHEYHTYKYDSLNNLIESSQFNANGFLVIKSLCKYNNHNDIIERKIFEANNAILKSHTTYQYKYDINNNWIEQVYYKNDGIPYILVKRKIEYY
ncbi:MAG: hypothetical protein VX762_00205 [Bacteroidota bacterium]|nr:hypothetical protein [Bacteroidota bacterium]